MVMCSADYIVTFVHFINGFGRITAALVRGRARDIIGRYISRYSSRYSAAAVHSKMAAI